MLLGRNSENEFWTSEFFGGGRKSGDLSSKQWTGLRKTKVILRLSGRFCERPLGGFLL